MSKTKTLTTISNLILSIPVVGDLPKDKYLSNPSNPLTRGLWCLESGSRTDLRHIHKQKNIKTKRRNDKGTEGAKEKRKKRQRTKGPNYKTTGCL